MIFFYLRHFLGFYRKKDWLSCNEIKDNKLYKNIYTKNLANKFFKDRRNFKILKKKLKVIPKKGWYLFGLKQLSENNKCFINIYSDSQFLQLREIKPGKTRWRLIRISKLKELKLEIFFRDKPIEISSIWMIKLPYIEAFRRIRKRHIKIYPSFKRICHRKNIKIIWKNYNNSFNRNLKSFNNYQKWIDLCEKKLQNKFIHSDDFLYKSNIVIQDYLNIRNVPNDSWVIPSSEDIILNPKLINIFNYAIYNKPNALIFYGDEDILNEYQRRSEADFKPCWDINLFLSNPRKWNAWLISGKLWNKNLNFLIDSGEKEIDFNKLIIMILLDIEINKLSKYIFHIPLICITKKSKDLLKLNFSNNVFLQKYINSSEGYIDKLLSIKLDKENNLQNFLWDIPEKTKLSILIPFRDNINLLKSCLNSIFENDAGLDFEIILINNNSKKKETYQFLEQLENQYNALNKFKVIEIKSEFNYSYLNNRASSFSSGNVLLLLNNDVVFLESGWGYKLSSNALRNNIGCVGAQLLYKDKTIQHAGVVLGLGSIAGHINKHSISTNDLGSFDSQITREYSALTGACLTISKKNWNLLDGLNEKNLKVNYSDVDLCLRARELGLSNLYLAEVKALHLESQTRKRPKGKNYREWKKEYNFFRNKWSHIISKDPCFNPNLSLFDENFSLGFREPDNYYIRSKFF